MMKQFAVFIVLVLTIAGCSIESKGDPVRTEKPSDAVAGKVTDVSVDEAGTAIGKGGVQFIDVRTVEEFKEGHARSAINVPLDGLTESLGKLSKEQPIYVICRTGSRSAAASQILKENGFTEIYNIKGGTLDWTAAKLPMESEQ